MWEDIERQAMRCLEAENHVARSSHFLGAIVLLVGYLTVTKKDQTPAEVVLADVAEHDPAHGHRLGYRLEPSQQES